MLGYNRASQVKKEPSYKFYQGRGSVEYDFYSRHGFLTIVLVVAIGINC